MHDGRRGTLNGGHAFLLRRVIVSTTKVIEVFFMLCIILERKTKLFALGIREFVMGFCVVGLNKAMIVNSSRNEPP